MPMSNINTTNQAPVVNRTASIVPSHEVRKERPQEDRNASAVVTLSAQARDLQKSEDLQMSSRSHIERIQEFNRSDEMAHAKAQANAKEEARVLDAKQKVDEQFNKRINVIA